MTTMLTPPSSTSSATAAAAGEADLIPLLRTADRRHRRGHRPTGRGARAAVDPDPVRAHRVRRRTGRAGSGAAGARRLPADPRRGGRSARQRGAAALPRSAAVTRAALAGQVSPSRISPAGRPRPALRRANRRVRTRAYRQHMGEREENLRRRRQLYEQMRLTGQKLGPLQRLRVRRKLRSWPPPRRTVRPAGGRRRGDEGGAGVREPRRPLPRSPQGAAELPRDPAEH